MGNIVNDPFHSNTQIYHGDANVSQAQVDNQLATDGSTMTREDESICTRFISEASGYLQRAKPIYDFHTKNRSFINLYKDLRKLGIENNKFFLVLYDRDLQNIDPYSPELPKDFQWKIYIECLVNPWYFLREVLRIPADGSPIEVGGGVQYRIDRNNAACWYLYLNGIDHYQSKPRQQGKTQDCIAKFLYAYLFGAMSSTILFFNKDQEYANINLYRMKCQRDMLPPYLQMRMVITEDGKTDKGVENTKSIRNPVTNNTVTTMGKATSKESAMKLGRGATAALQYLDEFDFIPYQTEIMNAAAFAYSTAARNAASANSLYGRILSSTPGDLDTMSGQAATEYIGKMLKWNDKMFDTPISKIKATITSAAYNRFVFVEHTWKQLRLDMAWYESQCSLVSFNEEVILREIDLKRIHGSDMSPFKRSDISYLTSHVRHPIEELDISKNLCPFLIYEKLHPSRTYMVCVDPAEGIGGDNTAVEIIDPKTLQPVVEFKSPYVSQPDLCDMLIKLMDAYCPRSMIIIESNRGRELLNCFLRTKYKYQLYYDDDKIMKPTTEIMDAHGRLKQAASERRAYGLTTSPSNRNQFFQVLEVLVEERKTALTGEYLVDDIAGLIKKPPSGRIEAGPGKHDDNVMAYLFGIFLYLNLPAEKLEEYGISRGASYDDEDDYDDDDTDTPFDPQKQMRKLQALLPSLPKEMQDLIGGALNQKSEADDVHQNLREIQKARELQAIQESEFSDIRGGRGDIRLPTPHNLDESYWDQFDSGLLDIGDTSQRGTIHIEDLVD